MPRIWTCGAGCILLFTIDAWAQPPDLIINRTRLARGIEVQSRTFSAESCAVQENCVRARGVRKVLLFEVAFSNIGQGDLVIGAPEEKPDLFQFSPCHEHYHLNDAATYALVSRNGRTLVTGRKQAFCFRDNNPISSSSPDGPRYNCDYMGITAGWEDVYDKSLDCQWLDVTGVPPGNYFLKVTVNPRRVFSEANYANNSTMVPVRIPGRVTAANRPRPNNNGSNNARTVRPRDIRIFVR